MRKKKAWIIALCSLIDPFIYYAVKKKKYPLLIFISTLTSIMFIALILVVTPITKVVNLVAFVTLIAAYLIKKIGSFIWFWRLMEYEGDLTLLDSQ